jgi:hypothetical protein
MILVMKHIKIMGIIMMLSLSQKGKSQGTQCYPNPSNGLYQYYIKLNLDTIPDSFDKTQLINYLYDESPSSNNPLLTEISSASKALSGERITNFLNHIVVLFSTNSRLDTVLSDFTGKLTNLEKFCFPQESLAYEPNDFNIVGGVSKQLTYVTADKAWDIHGADSRILIGISDTYLDTLHEDIRDNVSQVLANTMPNNPSASIVFHGTAVAGCLSAVTNNGRGVASIAGNARLVFSNIWGWDPEVLRIARIPGVRVINLSWVNNCGYSAIQDSLYRNIEDSFNVVVVASAGNDLAHCGSRSARCYPAALPSVICVTSVNHVNPPGYICPYVTPTRACLIEDRHEIFPGDTNSCHHHYPEVDISSTGYNVATTLYDSAHQQVHNLYTGGAYGTSFGGPIVASACALVASFNPCLTTGQIRDAVVNSANPSIYNITENTRYIGLLGVGKLDVRAALARAELLSTWFEQNRTYASNLTLPRFKIIAGRNVTAGTQGDVIIPSGLNIIYNVNHAVVLNDGFEVKTGATFEINFSESPCF